MSLFNRISIESEKNEGAQKRPSAFQLIEDPRDKARLLLLFRRPGQDADAEILWSRKFASPAERTAVIAKLSGDDTDITFWGRLILTMKTRALDDLVDGVAEKERERAAKVKEERRKHAAARRRIQSFVRDKNGRYYITLERDSDEKATWSMAFTGRAERERLRDWLRWQSERFLAFVEYAEEHGGAALEKRLIDEMFETELRVKQEGRSTGGLRPLRMWRGA
jgi:hypothetical protein